MAGVLMVDKGSIEVDKNEEGFVGCLYVQRKKNEERSALSRVTDREVEVPQNVSISKRHSLAKCVTCLPSVIDDWLQLQLCRNYC